MWGCYELRVRPENSKSVPDGFRPDVTGNFGFFYELSKF